MKPIESALNNISENLISLYRNTVEGWYELEIGLPKSWVVNETKDIGIEILAEDDNGKLLKIFPKKSNIVADDLVVFVELIIHTNRKIVEKENEFKKRMEDFKKTLEKETSKYFTELEELKDNSFKSLGNKSLDIKSDVKKSNRGRKPKQISITGTTS